MKAVVLAVGLCIAGAAQAEILTGYVGLDDGAIPNIPACPADMQTEDGMPLVFSKPFAPNVALTPDQFVITDSNGSQRDVVCATLFPAIGPNENRTVLLIGDLDSGPETIESVEVVASADGEELAFADGTSAVGDRVEDIRQLTDPIGTEMVIAEVFNPMNFLAAGCPMGTARVVWLTFDGGTNGGNTDTDNFKVQATRAFDGASVDADILAVVDADNDNHIGLCVDLPSPNFQIDYVSVQPGAYVDPMNVPNPFSDLRREDGWIVDGTFEQ